MSQQPSLTQSAHSVRQVLTAYNHEDRGDSTNYRKLAKHKIVLPGAIATTLAATNKCLAQSNKSAAGGKVTKKRSANQWVSTGH